MLSLQDYELQCVSKSCANWVNRCSYRVMMLDLVDYDLSSLFVVAVLFPPYFLFPPADPFSLSAGCLFPVLQNQKIYCLTLTLNNN